jgi:hypothetical protein
VHLALRDVEIDPGKGDDVAEGLDDPARTNGKRRPAGAPAGRRAPMLLSRCPETRQDVSELGM